MEYAWTKRYFSETVRYIFGYNKFVDKIHQFEAAWIGLFSLLQMRKKNFQTIEATPIS